MNFKEEVWSRALLDAEHCVMRCTATPTGGRKEGEDLRAYVERTRALQDAALARWEEAKRELQKAANPDA